MTKSRWYPLLAALCLCLAAVTGWVACASHVTGAFSIVPHRDTAAVAVVGRGMMPTIVRSDFGGTDARRVYFLANVPEVVGITSEAVFFATDSGTVVSGVPEAVTACKTTMDESIPVVRWLSAEYDPGTLVFDLRGVLREVARAVIIGDPGNELAEFYVCTPQGQWFRVGTNLTARRVVEFSNYIREFASEQID